MGKHGLSSAAEDFLKATLELERAGSRATTNGLARRLDVSAPTATAMAKRLDERGLVAREPYQGVTLTERGRLVALEVLRHHRLLERYLVESLGVPLEEVHVEADRLEHVISDELERRIDEALGFPSHDPHGDPIPDRELRLDEPWSKTLATLAPGDSSTVTRVPGKDADLLRYLARLGLVPGSSVEVILHAPFDGPVTVRAGGADHAIARELASAIDVA